MALQFRRGLEADLPSPTDAAIGEPLFTTDSGKLFIKKANGSFGQISGSSVWGSITGTLSAQTDLNSALTDLNSALAAKVNEADLPQDGSGNLDIAQESTLNSFASTLTSVQGSLANTQTDLDTAEATLASTAAITLTRADANNGYLYFTTSGIAGVPGTWTLQSPTFASPEFIDGGGADADNPS